MATVVDPQNQTPAVADTLGFGKSVRQIPDDVVQSLRTYVQDFASKNKLITGEEYTDQEIRFAVAKSISDLNMIPPISIAVFDVNQNGQVPATFILTWGAMNLLEMSIFRRLRNDLQYTDSGVTVDTEKFQKYLALLDSMRNYYYQIAYKFKLSLDVEGFTGYLPSSQSLFSFYFY